MKLNRKFLTFAWWQKMDIRNYSQCWIYILGYHFDTLGHFLEIWHLIWSRIDRLDNLNCSDMTIENMQWYIFILVSFSINFSEIYKIQHFCKLTLSWRLTMRVFLSVCSKMNVWQFRENLCTFINFSICKSFSQFYEFTKKHTIQSTLLLVQFYL